MKIYKTVSFEARVSNKKRTWLGPAICEGRTLAGLKAKLRGVALKNSEIALVKYERTRSVVG